MLINKEKIRYLIGKKLFFFLAKTVGKEGVKTISSFSQKHNNYTWNTGK